MKYKRASCKKVKRRGGGVIIVAICGYKKKKKKERYSEGTDLCGRGGGQASHRFAISGIGKESRWKVVS